MRTLEVTREFLEKTEELAKLAQVPDVKFRLTRLASDYRRKLKELERIEFEIDRAEIAALNTIARY